MTDAEEFENVGRRRVERRVLKLIICRMSNNGIDESFRQLVR